MKRKRLLIMLLISGLLLVLALMAYQQRHAHSHQANSQVTTTRVEVTTVQTKTIPETMTALGSLNAVDAVDVSPEIAGQVAKVYFKPGQLVKRGQALFQLDDALQQSEVKSAKADLSLSAVDFKRNQQLSKQGAISQETLDKARADYLAKKAVLDAKQVALDKMVLTAPFDGTVSAKAVSVGQYVAVGQTLVNVVDRKRLEVQFNVSQSYLNRLRLGQQVTIHATAFPHQQFHGQVFYISPTIDANSRTVEVRALINNDKGLLSPGLFVKVRQSLGQVQQALVLPREAIVASLDGDSVFQVIHGKAESMPVTIGVSANDDVQITHGLKAGDTVITAGQQKLRAGMPVKIVTSPRASS